MNLELLQREFNRVVDAPKAVHTLRKFVLEISIRGRLVPQDDNEADATNLLRDISIRKSATGFHGRTHSQRRRVENSPSIIGSFNLPSSWRWTTLSDIGIIQPRVSAEDTDLASFVPMASIPAAYGTSSTHEVRMWGEVKKGYTQFADGDVGLAKITPCFENGKSTVFNGLTGGFGAGTTELHIVRPILVNPYYVLIYLKSPYFVTSGIPLMTGTAGQKRVSTSYFKSAPFPLPPLAEQDRIVARVNEVLAICDSLEIARTERETRRDELRKSASRSVVSPGRRDDARFMMQNAGRLITRPEHVTELRQTILELAVRGRLTAQDPADEPAVILRDRLRSAITSDKSGDGAPVGPFELPSGWAWVRLSDLGKFGRGKSRHRPRNDPALFTDGIHPLVQTGDVARSGGVIRTFTGLYNDAGLQQSMMWPAGTLCITIAANIADTGILAFDACFPDSVVGLLVSSEFPNARYFDYFLRTAKRDLSAFAPATAQKNINLAILREVAVPLPPKNEIIRIVARVDELMAICDELQATLATKPVPQRKLLEVLLQDVLKDGIHSEEPAAPAGAGL